MPTMTGTGTETTTSITRDAIKILPPYLIYFLLLFFKFPTPHLVWLYDQANQLLDSIVSAARSFTCRDDLDSKWQLLLAA